LFAWLAASLVDASLSAMNDPDLAGASINTKKDQVVKLILHQQKKGAMTWILLLAAMNCYGLSPDQQAYCQAREQNNPGYCYSISDQALTARDSSA
jgi:hypothetical protein